MIHRKSPHVDNIFGSLRHLKVKIRWQISFLPQERAGVMHLAELLLYIAVLKVARHNLCFL